MKFRNHIIAACAAALLPLGAVAADATTDKPAAKQETAAKEKSDKADRNCKATTGSRIQSPKKDCTPSTSAARTYTAEELQNTGKLETAEALRQLDASIR